MRSCTYYVDKAREIGPSAKHFAELLLSGTFPWTKLRQAQKLVRLPDRYGKERVGEAASDPLRSTSSMCGGGRDHTEGPYQGRTEEEKTGTIALAFARPAAYFVKKEE